MKRSIIFGAVFIILLTLVLVSLRDWPSRIGEFLRYGYSLPSSMERRISIINGRQISFLIFHVPDGMQWGLASDTSSPKSVHEWRTLLNATVTINGSYFTETNEPAGYYVLAGMPNANSCPTFTDPSTTVGYTFGVDVSDGSLQLSYIPADDSFCQINDSTAKFASFPSLLVDGEPTVSADSGLFAKRTILAEGKFGVDVIITESGEVSLYEMARWLDVQSDDYTLAGNLDGGPSTGISVNAKPWNVELPSLAVPNILWAK